MRRCSRSDDGGIHSVLQKLIRIVFADNNIMFAAYSIYVAAILQRKHQRKHTRSWVLAHTSLLALKIYLPDSFTCVAKYIKLGLLPIMKSQISNTSFGPPGRLIIMPSL